MTEAEEPDEDEGGASGWGCVVVIVVIVMGLVTCHAIDKYSEVLKIEKQCSEQVVR
jgi:hypothetical protein